MSLSRGLIVTVTMGFGLSVAAGPAVAANSQPRPLQASMVTLAKGGTSKMHRKSATDDVSDSAARSPDGTEAPAGLPRCRRTRAAPTDPISLPAGPSVGPAARSGGVPAS